ncbi:MAG TPA: hypothetical protein VET88_02525 [Gammaproteobacteria bacterium]|nr:hypothetical protein [Gammaproteobacteria bacterium]
MRMPFSHALVVLDGELPKFARFTFIYLVERARRLLADCDLENSKEKLGCLDWFPLLLDPDRFIPESPETLREIEPHERDSTQPSLVYHHMQDFNQDDLQGYTWSEYFALMALNCISQVWLYEALIGDADIKDGKYFRNLQNTLAHFTAETAEAVTLGEQLLAREKEREGGNADSRAGNKISKHDSTALKKRHERITRLTQEFFLYDDPGEFPGQAAAVRKFLGELVDDKRELLASTHAERAMLGALRAHLKSANGSEDSHSASSDR